MSHDEAGKTISDEAREFLDEKWLARWFASKKREHNVIMELDPLPNYNSPIPLSHFFADFMGREIKKLFDEHVAALVTARDERIGREYDEKITKLNRIIDGCISVLHGPSRLRETAQLVEKERAAIMGGKE